MVTVRSLPSFLTVILLLKSAGIARGQAREFMHHEVSLGFGTAVSFELHPLNVSPESKVSPEVGIMLAYRYHFDDLLSVGLHLYGYTEKTPTYTVRDNQGVTRDLSFTLNAFNFGVQGRYAFVSAAVMPYAFAVLSYASGILQHEQDETLLYHGFSLGAGAGASVFVSQHIAFSLEGVASVGAANWTQKPFLNSSGTTYNPSMLGLFLTFSYLWAEEDAE
jgi:hypothetical protein